MVHTQILDGQVVHLVDGNTDTTMIPDDNNMVTQRESLEQHNNVNIQHDMELWQRIREYDQRSVEEPFATVLTKKHKQKLKQQQVLGNPSYRTHSRGNSSPNTQ